MCAFPGCKNKAASRGKKEDGTYATWKWCRFHRQGAGKKDRLALPTPKSK